MNIQNYNYMDTRKWISSLGFAKMTKQLFPLLLAIICVLACDKDRIEPTDNSNALNKIMPLGASRVEGARPHFESFRYELWKHLVDGGWDFDYIGTQEDEGSYPEYAGFRFDDDHEGRGGWTSGQILNGISDWLIEAGMPDIVLFSSPAGNDALEGLDYDQAIANVNETIDIIQAANPNVTIIIEQLAPAHSEEVTAELTNYFTRMQRDIPNIAVEQSSTSSQVLTVDMFTGFKDSYLADDVHYNEAGAAFIADRYYEILEDVLR